MAVLSTSTPAQAVVAVFPPGVSVRPSPVGQPSNVPQTELCPLFNLGRQKVCLRSLYIFVPPGCAVQGAQCVSANTSLLKSGPSGTHIRPLNRNAPPCVDREVALLARKQLALYELQLSIRSFTF